MKSEIHSTWATGLRCEEAKAKVRAINQQSAIQGSDDSLERLWRVPILLFGSLWVRFPGGCGSISFFREV